MTGLRYSPDMQIIFFSERAGQNTVETAIYLNDTAKKYTLARYRAEDVYANPGTLVSTRGTVSSGGRGAGGGGGGGRGGGGGGDRTGAGVGRWAERVLCRARSIDRNPNEVGPKTFIDKVAIKTGDKSRLYESSNDGVYERVTSILDIRERQLHRREGESRPRWRRTSWPRARSASS